MKPASKVRCNIMAIAKGYSCVSQPFFIARLALWNTIGLPRGASPSSRVFIPDSKPPRIPGLSLLSWYRRAPIFFFLKFIFYLWAYNHGEPRSGGTILLPRWEGRGGER